MEEHSLLTHRVKECLQALGALHKRSSATPVGTVPRGGCGLLTLLHFHCGSTDTVGMWL